MATEERRPAGRPQKRDQEHYEIPPINGTVDDLLSVMFDRMPKKEGEWEFQKKYGNKP